VNGVKAVFLAYLVLILLGIAYAFVLGVTGR
jgi:hypothetical protein